MESTSTTKKGHRWGDFESLEEDNERQKCIDRIKTLPIRNNLNFVTPFYQYQGYWYNSTYLEGLMLAQESFQAHPNDIILSSYPKTGTTWLKSLAFAIVTRSHYDDMSTNPLLTISPHDVVTHMEVDAAQGVDNRDPKIPLVATHSPFVSLPTSIFKTSNCKIVYICREPKDTFMSYWHFMSHQIRFPMYNINFDDAFEMFCEGVFPMGAYWEHVLEYWRASLECPERILFLRYEDLKSNTSFYVKKLAEFMGYPFTSDEEKQSVIDKIIRLCSFENLSSLEVNKTGECRPYSAFRTTKESFFRKGKVGDWKSAMTPEMGARVDRIMEQKLSGSGLKLWVN